MLKSVLIVFALLFAAPAWAQTASDLRDLLTAGDFDEARMMGEALGTAEGLRSGGGGSGLANILGEVGKLHSNSKVALKLAEKALELDPNLYEAKLQYALADGFVTRTTSDITSWRKGLPPKTLARIQAFRADYPQDPRGLALEGAWHLAIIRKLGEKKGEKWYGASLDKAETLYGEARRLAPNDVLIDTNYAMGYLALGGDIYGPKVKPILETIAAQPVNEYVYAQVQIKAGKVLAAYGDDKKVEKMAKRFLDGKPLE